MVVLVEPVHPVQDQVLGTNDDRARSILEGCGVGTKTCIAVFQEYLEVTYDSTAVDIRSHICRTDGQGTPA